MLGGASGANTGHFASFFYYTRARALLEGELAAQAGKIKKLKKEKFSGEKNQPRMACWSTSCAKTGDRCLENNKLPFQLNSGILCLDLNPGGAEEEEDATEALLALARQAAPEEKVTRSSCENTPSYNCCKLVVDLWSHVK